MKTQVCAGAEVWFSGGCVTMGGSFGCVRGDDERNSQLHLWHPTGKCVGLSAASAWPPPRPGDAGRFSPVSSCSRSGWRCESLGEWNDSKHSKHSKFQGHCHSSGSLGLWETCRDWNRRSASACGLRASTTSDFNEPFGSSDLWNHSAGLGRWILWCWQLAPCTMGCTFGLQGIHLPLFRTLWCQTGRNLIIFAAICGQLHADGGVFGRSPCQDQMDQMEGRPCRSIPPQHPSSLKVKIPKAFCCGEELWLVGCQDFQLSPRTTYKVLASYADPETTEEVSLLRVEPHTGVFTAISGYLWHFYSYISFSVSIQYISLDFNISATSSVPTSHSLRSQTSNPDTPRQHRSTPPRWQALLARRAMERQKGQELVFMYTYVTYVYLVYVISRSSRYI